MVAIVLLYGSALFRIIWSVAALSFAAQSPVSMDLFNALSLAFQGSGLLYGVALTVWFWKLWKNSMILSPQGATMNDGDLVWSTTKAVIWWYVPFVGLVKPYFLFKEIWQRTTAQGQESEGTTPPKKLLFWWIAVVLQTLFLALFNIAMSPTRPFELGPGYVYILLGMLATIATSIFGPPFFKAISSRETAKIREFERTQSPSR